jgi:hypothetical protein
VVNGRHDRNTNKSERRSQPRQLLENPYQQQAQQRRPERRDLDDDDEELGWWQQPQRSNAKPEQTQLEEWQVERLEEAYAIGRRKVSVSLPHCGLALETILHPAAKLDCART